MQDLKSKIQKFRNNFAEMESISQNAVSQDERLAAEIIEGLLTFIEEQDKAVMEGLEALGDNAVVKKYQEEGIYADQPGLTRAFAEIMAKQYDTEISHGKRLEKAFYALQNAAKKKREL